MGSSTSKNGYAGPKSRKRNKARPMGKRVALRECFEHGDKSRADWPRTAFWLAFHGFVKPEALDREANRRYPITPAGEAEQSWIAVKV
jgi:hypothetical protein